MSVKLSDEKKSEIFDKLHTLLNKYSDFLLKDTNDSNTSLMISTLTLTNTKIIESLTSDKQFNPIIIEHLMGILKINNEEILKMLVQRNDLEKKGLKLIKRALKLVKNQLKKL